MKNKKYCLYLDGASRGNPGPAGIGVVIRDSAGKKTIKELYKFLGETTNNVAEYEALIHGLEAARELGADELVVHVDSELVAKQMNGVYRVKDAGIKVLFERALGIVTCFKHVEIVHIDRSQNKAADALANKAINLSALV